MRITTCSVFSLSSNPTPFLARLTRRSSEKALRRLMESASTTREVLDVEKQLRNVITDKEKNAKQKTFYEKGAAFSTSG